MGNPHHFFQKPKLYQTLIEFVDNLQQSYLDDSGMDPDRIEQIKNIKKTKDTCAQRLKTNGKPSENKCILEVNAKIILGSIIHTADTIKESYKIRSPSNSKLYTLLSNLIDRLNLSEDDKTISKEVFKNHKQRVEDETSEKAAEKAL